LIRRNFCRTSYAAFLLEEISAGPKTQPFEEEMSKVQICSLLIGRNFSRTRYAAF
jgi:hypothetical protein